MKKIIVLLVLIGSFQSQAQMFGRDPIINLENWDKQRLYWGYYLGVGFYDFKFGNYYFRHFRKNNKKGNSYSGK